MVGARPLTRSDEIFHADLGTIVARTDRMFQWLLLGQWAAAILIALIWSPRTWIAEYWSIHQHVIAATVLGGLFAAYPLYLIKRRPGTAYTRHIIAIGQMLQSALLVHVTGGRIETHFHVFGSLALLAFYRDWPVLITGSAVVYLDHLALGAWFPLSVYGVVSASIWRSLEHAFWVIFEVVFLTMSCRKGVEELRAIAEREAELEWTAGALTRSNQELYVISEQLRQSNQDLEGRVAERTKELQTAKGRLEEHVRQLEALNQIMMDREERILELKEEVKRLRTETTAG